MTSEDTNPLHEAAEAIVTAFGASQSELAMAVVYHAMVEALIHPHNASAIKQIRRAAATHRRFGTQAEGLVAILGRDLEAVLAHLGIEPMDYDREVAPGVDEVEAHLVGLVEEKLGEELLKHADVGTPSGLAN